MPNSDIEVFDFLTSSSEILNEIDFLTYALFAYRKREWIDHFQSNNDRYPTQQEIDGWISQITQYEFREMRDRAAEFFRLAANEYLKEYIEDQKQQAVDKSILGEVQKSTSPARHLVI